MEIQAIHIAIGVVSFIAGAAALFVAGQRGWLPGGTQAIDKLEEGVALLEQNTQWFDLPETVLKEVIGVEVLDKFNSLVVESRAEVREMHASFKEALDRVAGIADRALALAEKATDGKPNQPPS